MAGHEIEKGEVNNLSPVERLHEDMRCKSHESQVQRNTTTTSKEVKDCTDQLLECTTECHDSGSECITECVEQYKECEYPWEEDENLSYDWDDWTVDAEETLQYDEGELISELLQIAGMLGGAATRTSTVDAKGNETKKIIIEYEVKK